MELTTIPEIGKSSLGEVLDRIETGVGRIGFNTAEQSLALLPLIDKAVQRLDEMENTTTRKTAESQLESALGKLRADARPFLRDLGGIQVLRAARERANAPEENWWWYLDQYVTERQRASLRRLLTLAGITAVVLIILTVVYRSFLAPDPAVAERYRYEQTSQDQLMAGDFEEAVRSAEAGLEYAPGDPALLIIKGVGEENLGQAGKAAQDYAQAQAGLETPEEFFLLRGQAYLAANLLDLAERDAEEAVRLNPESAMAYLLAGQIHEVRREFAEAIQYYDTAFETASRNNQPQLEAIARTRTAMVMQMMNMQVTPPVWFETPTPVP